MRSKRFFKVFLGAAIVFVFASAGAVQEALAAQNKTIPTAITVPAPDSGERMANFPSYEDCDAAEPYGSPYWGFMNDH